MKRSEMVKQIAEHVVKKGDLPVSRNDEFVASALIRKLEELGMQPPARTYEDWTGMGTETVTDNTWSPE